MIEIQHLRKTYGTTVAVDDVSLSIESGQVFGLLGPNGAGKSTMVKIITGLIRPTSGTVTIAGLDVIKMPVEVKQRIGYVPENAMLYESLTADEYLELVGDLRHLDRATLSQTRTELFDLFGITREDRAKLLSEFSKGMKQKVLLMSALIHNPEIIILDEPLSGLDANAALIIKEVMHKFAEQGKTIFFCSHVLDVVERLCQRIAIIDHGHVIADGTPHDIMSQTGELSLERAFNQLTGGGDIERSTEEVVRALSNRL